MSLQSLYGTINEKKINIDSTNEPPPIIDSDVSQYTNILAKKSYLNVDPLIKESQNVMPRPQPQRSAVTPTTVAPATNVNVNTLLQNVQRKYNSSTQQEKAIITKLLMALS